MTLGEGKSLENILRGTSFGNLPEPSRDIKLYPYNSSCKPLVCEKKGDVCHGDFYVRNSSYCNNQFGSHKQPTGCCPMGLYCLASTTNSSKLTCQTDNLGTACKESSGCYTPRTGTGVAQCVSDVCTQIYGAGDVCSHASDCYSANCTGGHCQGSPLNSKCTPRSTLTTCDTSLYCDPATSTCLTPLPADAVCTSPSLHGFPCSAGQYCGGEKCVEVGSLSTGRNCSGTCPTCSGYGGTLDPFLCDGGMGALYSQGTCSKGIEIPFINCTSDADCTKVYPHWDSECVCAPDGGGYCSFNHTIPYITGLDEGVNLMKCLAKNKCAYDYLSPKGMDYMSLAEDSCSAVSCGGIMKNFFDAFCPYLVATGSCRYISSCPSL